MALRPGEDALALENVVDELAAVGASVRVDRHAQAVLHVLHPAALELGHDSVVILGARVHLKSVAVAHHLKLLLARLLVQRLDLSVEGRRVQLDHLARCLLQVRNFAIVEGAVCGVAEAPEVTEVELVALGRGRRLLLLLGLRRGRLSSTLFGCH